MGSRAKGITKFHYERTSGYSSLENFTIKNIVQMIDWLIESGYLKLVGADYPVVKLRPKANDALNNQQPIPLPFSNKTHSKKRSPKLGTKSISSTVNETYGLFQQGISVEKIAQNRDLTIETIYGHLAKLIKAGKVLLAKVIPDKIIEKIEAAISEVGIDALSPIKDLLPEQIHYYQISCVVASHFKRSEKIDSSLFKDKVSQKIIKLYEKLESQNRSSFVCLMGDLQIDSALGMLIKALEDENVNVRRLSASALGKIGNSKAVPYLIKLLKDPAPQVRQYSIKALGSISDVRAAEYLYSIVNNSEEKYYNRKSAEKSLKWIEKNNSEFAIKSLRSYGVEDQEGLIKESPQADAGISTFLNKPHPRTIKGNWEQGYALDFHSRYQGDENIKTELGQMITDFKYHGKRELVKPLAESLTDFIKEHLEYENIDYIVSIPSTREVRAYQPVKLLAINLSKILKIPYNPSVLQKTRQTEQQKSMKNLNQKLSNVKGAFRVNKPKAVRNRHILLLDDLVNSGETLKEATRVLKRSGASTIFVLAITKTMTGGM